MPLVKITENKAVCPSNFLRFMKSKNIYQYFTKKCSSTSNVECTPTSLNSLFNH